MTTLLVLLFVAGWVAVALIGTQAYFRGEQTKPIHERNWRSESFEALAETLTGNKADYSTREHAFGPMDAYQSHVFPGA
ncbi:MAG: hypothetical protein AAGA75_04690 [Cyanobacteria bacterium P01_E01_bin.6]